MSDARDAARRRRVLAAAAAAALLPSRTSWAQAAQPAVGFPTRRVRIVVPYSVGIGPDVVARGVADQLAQRWGQPVVIENKPGASGIVAFTDVRRTPADGHTLFLADTATMAVNPLLHSSLPYDPQRDLVPLSLLFRATFLIWVGAGSRFRSVVELLDAARREPNGVSYASLGNGHASQIAIETMARAAGVRLMHVAFKEGGPLFSAVAAGQVDFTAFSYNTLAGLMAAGKLRPLAVAARSRLANLPDVPTLAEAGGPAVTMHPWAALVAVAGTPPPVLDKLQRDIAAALVAPEVRAQAERTGFEITPSTPQAVRERIEADIAAYRPLVEEGRVSRV